MIKLQIKHCLAVLDMAREFESIILQIWSDKRKRKEQTNKEALGLSEFRTRPSKKTSIRIINLKKKNCIRFLIRTNKIWMFKPDLDRSLFQMRIWIRIFKKIKSSTDFLVSYKCCLIFIGVGVEFLWSSFGPWTVCPKSFVYFYIVSCYCFNLTCSINIRQCRLIDSPIRARTSELFVELSSNFGSILRILKKKNLMVHHNNQN